MCLMCCHGLQTVSVVSTKYCYMHVFFISGACCNGLCLVSVDIVTCMFSFQEHAVMVCGHVSYVYTH